MSALSAEAVWYDAARWARMTRGALAPAGWVYGAAARLRNRLYDVRALRSVELGMPALSVGNVTAGGTGKTPVSAWAARRLIAAGAHPAIVLRGYGDDEPLVHRRLTPLAIVIADADRVRGAKRAAASGADCVILDDAFQHRRAARLQDWVLVSAEQWRHAQRCLPAGPLREPLRGVQRATNVIVTRKSASRQAADDVAARVHDVSPQSAIAIMHLAPAGLVNAMNGSRAPLEALRDTRVLAIAGVGAPDAFFAQLREAGAHVEAVRFRDHHAFSDAEAADLAARGARFDMVLCTLKDAVKLVPRWPHEAGPLWYVSQSPVVEQGAAELDASLANILAARTSAPSTAGSAGLASSDHGHRSSTTHQ